MREIATEVPLKIETPASINILDEPDFQKLRLKPIPRPHRTPAYSTDQRCQWS